MINKLLKIKFIKVLLCILENFIKRVSLKVWKKIEIYFFNPYDFWENNVEYTKRLWSEVYEYCKKYKLDIKNKNLLELWPWGFLWVWAFLKNKWLNKYYVIDNINHFEKINKKIKKLYNNINKSFLKSDYFDMEFVKILDYKNNQISLDNNKIDIIFSKAVYEHIYDVEKSIKELARISKKWAIWIHTIDLKDHIFDKTSLYFLTINNFIFDLLFKKSWAWVNRKRYWFYKKVFLENWFEILEEIIWKNFDEKSLKKYKKKIKLEKNDLIISDYTLIVRKK